MLIRFFAQKHAGRMNRNIERIPSGAMEAYPLRLAGQYPANCRT